MKNVKISIPAGRANPTTKEMDFLDFVMFAKRNPNVIDNGASHSRLDTSVIKGPGYNRRSRPGHGL